MANSSFGSREGLTVRSAASSSSNEISVQIDPINADLDDHWRNAYIFGRRE
ncbi:hypothetical protein ACP70R_013590 [Stipagrostis hirtigluma subsp. patula]